MYPFLPHAGLCMRDKRCFQGRSVRGDDTRGHVREVIPVRFFRSAAGRSPRSSAEMRREVFRKRMTAQSFGRSLWLSFVSGTFVARHSLGGSANQVSARTNRPRGRSRRSPSPEETSVIAATWKEGSEWKVSEPVRDVSISLPKPSKTNREGKRNITR